MKHVFVVISFLLVALSSFAQDEQAESSATSSFGGDGTLTFSSTGFGDYYSGGGLNSTTFGSLLNAYLNNTYENGGKFENLLRIDYGVAKIENTNDEKFTKASDVIDLYSKYGTPIKRTESWYYAATLNVLTQLTDTRTAYLGDGQYQELIGIDGETYGTRQSSLFAPGDITLAIGVDFNPNETFSAFYGPLSGKLRMVSEDNIANSQLFGNEFGEKTRFEAGSSAFVNYTENFLI